MDEVSVLFSEPKIPQCSRQSVERRDDRNVSVLFSEPKIPQFAGILLPASAGRGFSALQRAENSSIYAGNAAHPHPDRVSVLFSEPKIPQSRRAAHNATKRLCFSALQRAENSSMPIRSGGRG